MKSSIVILFSLGWSTLFNYSVQASNEQVTVGKFGWRGIDPESESITYPCLWCCFPTAWSSKTLNDAFYLSRMISIALSCSTTNSKLNIEMNLYRSKGNTFVCFDGSLKIPREAVNDDFCDCPDGSDEPGKRFLNQLLLCFQVLGGSILVLVIYLFLLSISCAPIGTTACRNGKFYCANKGHLPAVISSSFVNDGYCGMQSE
jgi:hypothetical protein